MWGKMQANWEIGQTIDGLYEIFGANAGGMGAVYFVNHLKWKIPLAVKTPLPALIKSPSAYQRYIKEAETWINIGMHPHIVTCFYVRDLGGIPRIFIEYVSGGTLKDLIDKRQLGDIGYVLDLAIQFSMAMEYVHDQGIIHRDIKPANCMITGDGELKVTDFGIAKLGDDLPDTDENPRFASSYEGLTMTGTGFGTPEYMAPEQFLDAKNIGKEADIYAFGVMLYEMVCGVRPFVMPSGMNTQARDYFYRNAHFNETPRPPIEINSPIPQLLNHMIMKCLEKDVSKRFRSFDQIYTMLSECCNEVGTSNNRVKPDVLKLKADSLNNKAASFLDLGRGEEAVRCWQQALEEDPQHLEATFNFGYHQWQEGAPYKYVLSAQMLNLVSIHKDRPEYSCLLAWLCYKLGNIDSLNELQKSIHRVKDPDFLKLYDNLNTKEGRWVRVFKGHRNYVTTVAFSPDGRYILSGSSDTTVRLWDTATATELRRFEGHFNTIWSVAFSSDGNYILSGSEDKTVRLWGTATGKEHMRFEGHRNTVLSVAFSYDGNYIVSGSEDKTVRLWDTATGKELRQLVDHNYSVCVWSVAFSPDTRFILTGSWDNTIRLCETATGKMVRQFVGHLGSVNSVAFSPDGIFVLSGSSDTTVRLWDTATATELRRFEGHNEYVTSVAFSPDGRYILSISGDQTLRLWEVASAKEIRRFEGHSDNLSTVAYSPDGKYVLSGSGDNNTFRLFLWDSLAMRPSVAIFPVLSHIRTSANLFDESREVQLLLSSATTYIGKGALKDAYMLLRKIQAVRSYEKNDKVLNLINLCGTCHSL